jgi:hypothetical protein
VVACLLPAFAFAVQEHAERLAEGASFTHPTLLESAVVLGLAIQLPGGLIAVALVRLLLRLTDRVFELLRSRRKPRRPLPGRPRWACTVFEPIVSTGRRGAIGLRAPPPAPA